MSTKKCTNINCKQLNPQLLSNFCKNIKAPDGLQWWCKSCQKEHRQSPEAKQSEKERSKTTKRREALRKWRTTPAAIQRRKELVNTPEYKAVAKKRREKLEIKQAIRERQKTPHAKKQQRGGRLKKFWPGSNWQESLNNYDQLFAKQDGRCAICNKHQSELKKLLEVDHCHKTGKVRGLLCDLHNKALGLLQDQPLLLDNAKNYLIKNS